MISNKEDLLERLSRLEGMLEILIKNIEELQDSCSIFEEEINQQVDNAYILYDNEVVELKKLSQINKLEIVKIKTKQTIIFGILGAVSSAILVEVIKMIVT